MVNRAHVIAKPASNAIVLANARLWTRGNSLLLAIGTDRVRIGSDGFSRSVNQIDALMRGVIAGHIAEIASDALLFVDARHRSKRKIEILKIGNLRDAFSSHFIDRTEPLDIHPIRKAVTQILDDPVAVMHRRR